MANYPIFKPNMAATKRAKAKLQRRIAGRGSSADGAWGGTSVGAGRSAAFAAPFDALLERMCERKRATGTYFLPSGIRYGRRDALGRMVVAPAIRAGRMLGGGSSGDPSVSAGIAAQIRRAR